MSWQAWRGQGKVGIVQGLDLFVVPFWWFQTTYVGSVDVCFSGSFFSNSVHFSLLLLVSVFNRFELILFDFLLNFLQSVEFWLELIVVEVWRSQMNFEPTSWVAHFHEYTQYQYLSVSTLTAILQVSPRSPSKGPVYIYTRTNMYTSHQDTRPYLSPLFNQTYICTCRFFCSDKISHMIDNECFSGF